MVLPEGSLILNAGAGSPTATFAGGLGASASWWGLLCRKEAGSEAGHELGEGIKHTRRCRGVQRRIRRTDWQWVGSCKVGGKLVASGGAGKRSGNSPRRRPSWLSSTLP